MNQRIEGHSLVGTKHVYCADLPPYDAAADTEPGVIVLGHGHHVEVLAVFKNWNAVTGLDMFAVRCDETGQSTHVTPADLGLPPLD
ncbi:hypothetical protein A5741_31980 [Mycolicibacterium conceptionense]|uniref:hypothetical protein n=1 Tax=Mycolicibacterium conceptionense TaxID=451644 RepID=UPI00096C6A53|nr:hypothetical protein [Mycolicibacterium conceptionense]OMB76665.1 hypothetical protein A5741_31980 [Mycolicibacterium conceptionense]